MVFTTGIFILNFAPCVMAAENSSDEAPSSEYTGTTADAQPEGEARDAVLTKVMDLEENQKQMEKEQNIRNFIIYGALILLAALIVLTKKK
jgi:hypothetical protein